MEFLTVTEISDTEWKVEIDETFLDFFMDSLFSWAKRGPKTSQTVFESSNPEDDYKDLDSKIVFGKHKGKTWRKVLNTDPEYVQWAVVKVDRIPDWFKKLLEEGDKF